MSDVIGHASTGELTVSYPGGNRRLADGESVVAGRASDCELSISDAGASRRHVQLTRQGATVVVTDLGSSNGTWVAGNRIQSPTAVSAGGFVQLGGPAGPGLQVGFLPAPHAYSPVLAPSNTGVVFDRFSLPSGPMPARPPQVLGIGRGRENQIVLDDLLASRRHTQLLPRPGGFEVRDLGSRNGTYVNGQRIAVAHLGEGDLLAVGHSRFTVARGQLVVSVDQGDVAFIVNHLSYVLPGGKRLLDDVSFALPGSSLLAIIGPSGAGKSTMLKAMTGAAPATSGEVYYDGRDLYQNFQDLRHRIFVVPQDDVVHRQLTVRHALRFAAELRFPDDLDTHLRDQRVEEVIGELGLTEHAGTRVDRLSGGQRKRTSVALSC